MIVLEDRPLIEWYKQGLFSVLALMHPKGLKDNDVGKILFQIFGASVTESFKAPLEYSTRIPLDRIKFELNLS